MRTLEKAGVGAAGIALGAAGVRGLTPRTSTSACRGPSSLLMVALVMVALACGSQAPPPADENDALAQAPPPADENDALAQAPPPADENDALAQAPSPADENDALAQAPPPADENDALAQAPPPADENDALAQAPPPADENDALAQAPPPADENDALAPETPPATDAIIDDGRFIEFVDGGVWRRVSAGGGASGSAIANRIEFLDGDSLHEPVLWSGGRFQFTDICPEWGCAAVQFGTDGEVAHAWPLRPDALERAARDAATDEFPFVTNPGYSFARDVNPFGISRYPNGDLLVTFVNQNSTSRPSSANVARIDRQGYPVWFRRDHSHHWPHVDDDGSALVLGRLVVDEPMSIPMGGSNTLSLPRCYPYSARESVDVIDENGRLLDSIDLIGAVLDSPFALVLLDSSPAAAPWTRSPAPCNFVHSNYVHRIAGDVPDVWGMSSGDLVVSMRNVSAFAILDAGSGRLKRLVRGSFRWQHSVHHWEGSRFLLFDNLGRDGPHGPSRLLMVDLADGRETTIFPNDGTPEALRGLFSPIAGNMSISRDRRRALVVFSKAGVAVEVRLSDGAALKVFRSLHDVSGLEQFPEERAARFAVFEMNGLDYSFFDGP